MKKLLSSILIIIYLTLSLGMTLTIHHCLGKVSNTECGIVDILHSCNQPLKEAGCCSNEIHLIKLTLDQKDLQLSAIDFSSTKELLFSNLWKAPFIHNTLKSYEYIIANRITLQESKIPLYLFHCLLLI